MGVPDAIGRTTTALRSSRRLQSSQLSRRPVKRFCRGGGSAPTTKPPRYVGFVAVPTNARSSCGSGDSNRIVRVDDRSSRHSRLRQLPQLRWPIFDCELRTHWNDLPRLSSTTKWDVNGFVTRRGSPLPVG